MKYTFQSSILLLSSFFTQAQYNPEHWIVDNHITNIEALGIIDFTSGYDLDCANTKWNIHFQVENDLGVYSQKFVN